MATRNRSGRRVIGRWVVFGLALGIGVADSTSGADGDDAKAVARRNAGRDLFLREWVPGVPSERGDDGLGPDYNETSCVACPNQGGIGGGGGADKNMTQASTISLTKAVDRMRSSFVTWDRATVKLGNRAGGFSAGFMGAMGQGVGTKIGEAILGKLPTQDFAEEVDKHFGAKISGLLEGGWALIHGRDPIAAAKQGEIDALKVPAPVMALDSWAKSLHDFAKSGPFLPPRHVAPVRP
jgi:hypothetical protein